MQKRENLKVKPNSILWMERFLKKDFKNKGSGSAKGKRFKEFRSVFKQIY